MRSLWVLTEDAEGRIYAGTVSGAERFDPATGRFKHYTPDDGLRRSPPCCSRDREGRYGSARLRACRANPQPDRR
jgi:hypothetical protein